jgi:hypothetical protein
MDKKTVIVIIIILIIIYLHVRNFENFDSDQYYIKSKYIEKSDGLVTDVYNIVKTQNQSNIRNYFNVTKNIVNNLNLPKKLEKNMLNETYDNSYNFYKKLVKKYNEYFGTITCNYIYTLYIGSPPINNTNIYPGEMYLDTSNKLTLNRNDLNNMNGILSQLSTVSNIVLTSDNITKTININNFNIINQNTVSINLENIPKDFFVSQKTYIIYPCLSDNSNSPSNSHSISSGNLTASSIVEFSPQKFIVDNNINNSFLYFFYFIIFLVIYMNWEYFYRIISNMFSSSKVKEINPSTGGKIYYIGGYDYRDYSD